MDPTETINPAAGKFVFYILLAGLIFVLGAAIGANRQSSEEATKYRQQAIEHHAAHYDTVTGKWQWNKK